VIQTEFDADRALVIDEAADANVVLRSEQTRAENFREREFVGALDAVNGEVVAQGCLRNMDVRGSPVFLVVSPRKISFSVAEEPDKRIAAILDGRLEWNGRRLRVHRCTRCEHS